MDLYFVGMKFNRQGAQKELNEFMMDELQGNCLLSYVNDRKEIDKRIAETNYKGKFFIDSGAFTMWTKGKSIDVDAYIDFINQRSDFIDLYGQVDFIPGDIVKGATKEQVEEAAKKTWENYLYMRPRMKKPEGLLYTFHVGEPYKYLKQALEWRDEEGKPIAYMALGGMVGKPMPIKQQFLDTCFEIIKKSSNPNIKIHAFGMTSFDLLEQYPITSADSTSYIMTAINGGIMTPSGILDVSTKKSYNSNHFSYLQDNYIEEFNKSIDKYGFSLQELSDSCNNRIIFNAKYMQEKANNLTYKPKLKTFKLF